MTGSDPAISTIGRNLLPEVTGLAASQRPDDAVDKCRRYFT